MKELRPGSVGRSEIRILFAFDPVRRVILLVAGDKSGQWQKWYRTHVPLADDRFDEHVEGRWSVTMYITWDEYEAQHPLSEEQAARIEELKAQMLAEVRAYRLAEIRRAYGLNQTEVGHRLGISQARVSQIERGDLDHTEVSTLRGYVAALGGEVEIVARFGGERFTVA